MTDLQEDLTLALQRRAEAVTVENQLDAILDDHNIVRFSYSIGRDLRRSRGLLVAASVAVLVGAGGLIWATNSRTQPPSPSSPAASPVDAIPGLPDPTAASGNSSVATSIAVAPQPLSSTELLEPSDWVIARTPPSGTEFVLARRDGAEPDVIQIVAYGPPDGDGSDFELIIEIDRPRSPATGDTITVGGATWAINQADPGWWNVSRSVGESDVGVRGTGEIDESLLASLVVVDDAGLPLAPLGNRDDAVIVARTNVGDETYTYAAQEAGRHGCHWLMTSGVGGGHRCGPIPQDDVVTIVATQALLEDPTDSKLAIAWGSATGDVATVDVEFADGTVITADATDLSGTFAKRFWIAAAAVATGSDQTPADTQEAVVEVRAYDIDRNVLGTATPTGLENG
jgi:hypothetical protein